MRICLASKRLKTSVRINIGVYFDATEGLSASRLIRAIQQAALVQARDTKIQLAPSVQQVLVTPSR